MGRVPTNEGRGARLLSRARRPATAGGRFLPRGESTCQVGAAGPLLGLEDPRRMISRRFAPLASLGCLLILGVVLVGPAAFAQAPKSGSGFPVERLRIN